MLCVYAVVSAGCRRVLHEAEVERKLIALLGPERSPLLQTAAALALGIMAESDVGRDTISKLGK